MNPVGAIELDEDQGPMEATRLLSECLHSHASVWLVTPDSRSQIAAAGCEQLASWTWGDGDDYVMLAGAIS